MLLFVLVITDYRLIDENIYCSFDFPFVKIIEVFFIKSSYCFTNVGNNDNKNL